MIENKQAPVAKNYVSDKLVVHSIFKTIQGEGPFSGERALFIRLWGCNLQCKGCDTEYTSRAEPYTPQGLVAAVSDLAWPQGALIVLTGGEPFRQNVVPVLFELLRLGWRVQVETNGVLAPPLLKLISSIPEFTIVCSPKTSRLDKEVTARAAAFKYVIRAGEVADDGLPIRALGHPATPHVARPRPGALVFVQPMDENDPVANEANLQAAVASCVKHGYRLQLQLHKLIGLE